MNTVEETVVLDETIFDDTAKCGSALGCDSTAEWACVMRCCGNGAVLCTRCLLIAKKNADGYNIECMSCHHYFGYVDFNEIVRVNPI